LGWTLGPATGLAITKIIESKIWAKNNTI
jgi:hypothetical protein